MSEISPDRHAQLARELWEQAGPRWRGSSSLDDVAGAQLAVHAAHLLDEDPVLRRLAERSGDALAMRHGLARLPLPKRMGDLLNYCRTERPVLFRHTLIVTLVAHYLALRANLSERSTQTLLLAALGHDLGELLVDAALLEPEHRVTDAERGYIYAHPLISHLLVHDLPGFELGAATAIQQHQERLDGSGYPYGLKGKQIGIEARMIGIADVCAAILARFGSSQRLSALMRLNRIKFDARLLTLLRDGFDELGAAPDEAAAISPPRLAAASSLLEQWGRYRGEMRDADTPPAELEFLFERMANLRSMLLQFGFDPESQDMLLALASEDEQLAAELAAALDEVHWQFADLEREILRRSAARTRDAADEIGQVLERWRHALRDYLAACSAAAPS